MLNTVSIMGRLVDDPEVKSTDVQPFVQFATFQLACERDFTGKDRIRKTDTIPVSVWRGNASYAEKNFRAGDLAVVTGRIQVNEVKDAKGNTKQFIEIHATDLYRCV